MAGHGEHTANDNAPKLSAEVAEKWWKLPFDASTNFSILGFFLGRLFDRGDYGKKVDFSLDEK